MSQEASTCDWPANDKLMLAYHDEEWGVPIYDDHKWYEFILLDAFQAGLSWRTVLHKRDGFKQAFANFNPEKVARFTDQKLLELQQNQAIIRNKLKIKSARQNAQALLSFQDKKGSFSDFLWSFTNGKTKVNNWKSSSEIPATTAESDAMSKALKKEGFNFVGSTICYAFMQAGGIVNDHLVTCKRHQEVQKHIKP